MPNVKLNSYSNDVEMELKIFGNSETFGIKAFVFIKYFFFLSLTQK